jgi:hypothetical protein
MQSGDGGDKTRCAALSRISASSVPSNPSCSIGRANSCVRQRAPGHRVSETLKIGLIFNSSRSVGKWEPTLQIISSRFSIMRTGKAPERRIRRRPRKKSRLTPFRRDICTRSSLVGNIYSHPPSVTSLSRDISTQRRGEGVGIHCNAVRACSVPPKMDAASRMGQDKICQSGSIRAR